MCPFKLLSSLSSSMMFNLFNIIIALWQHLCAFYLFIYLFNVTILFCFSSPAWYSTMYIPFDAIRSQNIVWFAGSFCSTLFFSFSKAHFVNYCMSDMKSQYSSTLLTLWRKKNSNENSLVSIFICPFSSTCCIKMFKLTTLQVRIVGIDRRKFQWNQKNDITEMSVKINKAFRKLQNVKK